MSTSASTSEQANPYEASPSTPPEESRGPKSRTILKGILALVDQAFVSGARFGTSILVGRFAGQESLGFYSLGFSLLVLATCVQESLITAPYTVLFSKHDGDARRRYNGSTLAHVLLLSVLSVVLFALSGLWLQSRNQSAMAAVMGCLAISTPFALLREYARRVEFAQLRLTHSVLIDGAVATLQIGLLGWLAAVNRFDASMAFLATGIASALGSLAWLSVVYGTFKLERFQIWPDLVSGWNLGRWMFSAQLVGLLHLQGMYWVIAAWLSPAQTGLFAACSTLVLFVNPFALGLNNFIGPMAVQATRHNGLSAVRRLIGRAAALMFVSLMAFTLLIFAFSDPIMKLLFDQPEYLGQRWLILLLGINMTSNAANMVLDNGLWAAEHPQPIFWASAIAVGVSLVLALLMVPRFELLGAAASLTLGRVAAVLLEAYAYFIMLSHDDLVAHPSGVADA